MTEQHPITPSTELVQKWINEENGLFAEHLATQAARWGADQELYACVKWLSGQRWEALAINLRAVRRPKPPSLKEQASESLDKVVECLKMLVPGASVDGVHIETIRRALEALPDD